MGSSKIASWLVFLGVLLTLSSIGLSSAVVAAWEQANGAHGLNKVTANVDAAKGQGVAAPTSAQISQSGTAPASGLSLREAERLAKLWGPRPIEYTAWQSGKVSAGTSSANSRVVGVSALYRDFAHIPMTEGAFPGEAAIAEHSRVAAIGAGLADRLFHSTRVVGQTLELWNAPFTIIGVYDDRFTLLGQMADDGIPQVYVPVTALLDVRPQAAITGIDLAVAGAALGGTDEAQQALTALGQDPARFALDDGVRDRTLAQQLPQQLRFACGAAAIAMLLSLALAQASHAIARYRRRLAVDDAPDALRAEWRHLLARTLAVVALLGAAVLVWRGILFRLYIPPDWVPNELIDLSFYMDRLRAFWQLNLQQAGYVPSAQEALTAAAGRLTAALWALGAFLGLPLFTLGARLWAAARVPLPAQWQRLLLYVPAAIAAAIAATFAVARWAGMDYLPRLADIAIPSLFFAVAAYYFQQRSVE
ncbi:MAG: hypothetical protein K0R75_627 [Paenibacillaceae bacterium]|jgi:hypothetical protein|nr:hypothetical protein [Paenibacillaceae bacterium]